MKIVKDESLCYFEFWSGGAEHAEELTAEQLDAIERNLTEVYPDGIDATTLNDLFWFEPDTLAEWLGYDDWDALIEAKNAA